MGAILRCAVLPVLLAAVMLGPARPAAAQPEPAAMDSPGEHDARMQWWRDARFGLFIHWGLYAIPAGEWKGQTNHAEWIRTTAQIPLEQYDEFVTQFNPVQFDADAWVRVAKDAGMKYIVITSKHHDGFCLFDSEHTDFDIMSTPFRRDIMAELAEACREHGLRMCWYHSIMDWHHPDYLPRRGWEDRPAEGADFSRYEDYLHAEVTELLTKYGDIGIMWFDGEWESTWTHEHGQALFDLCRRLQPQSIVNNRVDKGRAGMAGMTTGRQFLGDYGTPEQEIPETGLPGVDWETCMTMNDHWGYNEHDEHWKSSRELIRMLVDIASKGGNFLLNVGPTAEGTFPEPSVERLRAMGAWMKMNGESIYGTTASPFRHLPWGRCTARVERDRTTLYLHVFDWPDDGTVVVPGLGNEVRRATLLGAAGTTLFTARDEGDVVIDVPAAPIDEDCTVIALEIEGAPIVYEMPEIRAVSAIFVRPLEVELEATSGLLEIRYTLDGTRPAELSPIYDRPLLIGDTTTVKARTFHVDRAVSGVAERTFTRAEPIPAVTLPESAPGLECEVYHGSWDVLPDFDALEADAVETVQRIGLGPGPAEEHVARRLRGCLRVPRDDVYMFALDSDDGSRLVIADRVVIDNDGLHGPRELQGTIALGAGLHLVTIEYFNKTGGAELNLRFAPLGEPLRRVAPDALVHVPAPD